MSCWCSVCWCAPQKEPKTSVLVVLLLELANHFARRSSSREAASQTDSDPSSWSSLLGGTLACIARLVMP